MDYVIAGLCHWWRRRAGACASIWLSSKCLNDKRYARGFRLQIRVSRWVIVCTEHIIYISRKNTYMNNIDVLCRRDVCTRWWWYGEFWYQWFYMMLTCGGDEDDVFAYIANDLSSPITKRYVYIYVEIYACMMCDWKTIECWWSPRFEVMLMMRLCKFGVQLWHAFLCLIKIQ